MVAGTKLPVNTSASAMDMANAIFGDGVTVTGASFTGDNNASGIWTNGDSIANGVAPSDTGVILSTGRASNFTRSGSQSNASTNQSTNNSGVDNSSQFNAIAGGARTYDASWIDADFIPTGDTMTMQFVFSSEEYPEYAGSIYNDVVGVWINGTHVPMTVGITSVSNVNHTSNVNLYQDNTSDQFNTEMDGFTVTMTLTIPVNAGVVNSIRIGIADTSDSSYDSNLLIAGNSVQTALVAHDDAVSMQLGVTKTLDVLANDAATASGTLTITHINGQAVVAGSTVTLQTGQQITLNADGTLSLTADNDAETVNFTYKVQDSTGRTDTGFVTMATVPCFVAGTKITTPTGLRDVAELAVGDMVMTRDDGPQPLVWVGQRTVAAVGDMAPIAIRAGALGGHDSLKLSPQHRVMVSDAMAELLFGETEVLIAAKHLVNDSTIRRVEGGEVTYVHLLFERHHIIKAAGLNCESFLPGPEVMDGFEADARHEICTLFPELDPETGAGYAPPARRLLRGFEARALMGAA